MPQKQTKSNLDKVNEVAATGGLLLMTAAVTLGLVELPNQPEKRAVIPARPLFASVPSLGEDNGNALRREREEAGPHYVSYNVTQRTPGRTGKI